MATGAEVLTMLLPGGGWILTGNDYNGIEFIDCEPITEESYQKGFADYDAWQTKQNEEKQSAKETAQLKLAALGLTTDDLEALGL